MESQSQLSFVLSTGVGLVERLLKSKVYNSNLKKNINKRASQKGECEGVDIIIVLNTSIA